jgi:hypothetical protein
MARRFCANGHYTDDNRMAFCPLCGAPFPQVQQVPVAPPVQQEPKKKSRRGRLLVVLSGFLGLAILCRTVNSVGSPPQGNTVPTEKTVASRDTPVPKIGDLTASATPIVKSTPTPGDMAPPFDELCRKDPNLTDIQMEKHLEGFIGKRIVNWQGWVYEVHDQSGGYVVLVALNPPGGLLWTRDIEIADIPEDLAFRLSKRQKITFSGTIRKVGIFLGSICNPISIESATITE